MMNRKERKRVAVYGGSFDPIHNGHVMLANYVASAGIVDEVWLMVSPQNPLKRDSTLSDSELRLEMARVAVDGLKGVKVSFFENTLPRPSFTFATLRALAEAYPDTDFILLVGSDNWAIFGQWREAEYILRNHGLLVYPRPGYPVEGVFPRGIPSELANRVVILSDAPVAEISSTYIRERLSRGEDMRGFIPESVARIVSRYGLYKLRAYLIIILACRVADYGDILNFI